MTKDDQRVRETVQAELRRRRGALDRSEERYERTGTSVSPAASGHNGHAAPPGEEQRGQLRGRWPLPPRSSLTSPSETTSD
jgi:hypothetical protein